MFVNTKLSNQRWNHIPKRDLSFFLSFFMSFSPFISFIVQWPSGGHALTQHRQIRCLHLVHLRVLMFPHSRAAVAVSLGSMVVGFTSAWSAGRVLAGLCIGVTSVSLPIYLAEVLDPEVRGRVTRLSSSNWPLSRKLGRVALLHSSQLRVWLVTGNVFQILLYEKC